MQQLYLLRGLPGRQKIVKFATLNLVKKSDEKLFELMSTLCKMPSIEASLVQVVI